LPQELEKIVPMLFAKIEILARSLFIVDSVERVVHPEVWDRILTTRPSEDEQSSSFKCIPMSVTGTAIQKD
jgi:hypothetical protein